MAPILNNIIQFQEPTGPKGPMKIHQEHIVSHRKYKTDNNHESRLIYQWQCLQGSCFSIHAILGHDQML